MIKKIMRHMWQKGKNGQTTEGVREFIKWNLDKLPDRRMKGIYNITREIAS